MQEKITGSGREAGLVDGGASHDGLAEFARIAGVLQKMYREVGAPPAMDPWLDALDRHLAPYRMAPPEHLDPVLFQAALPVLARRPAHPALPLWHARALLHLRNPRSADGALCAATFAFEYSLRSGNFRAAHEIIEQARSHIVTASTQVRVAWLEAEALEAWLAGDHQRAYAVVNTALAQGAGYDAWEQGASAALSWGDLRRADECLAAMARYGSSMRPQDYAHAAFLAAARARLGGDNAAAQAHMSACLAVDATAVPAYFTTLWQLGQVYLDIAMRRHRSATRGISSVLTRASTSYWGFLQFSALLARAWLRVRMNRLADAAADLEAALTVATANAYRNCDPWWDPEAFGDLARVAPLTAHAHRDTLAGLARRSAP